MLKNYFTQYGKVTTLNITYVSSVGVATKSYHVGIGIMSLYIRRT